MDSAWGARRARGTDALWITHAGVIRAVLALERGVRSQMGASQWPSDAIRSGASYAVKSGPACRDGAGS